MVGSVNTNASAMASLQHLTKTNDALERTQERVASGLKIENAGDNAAIFAVAQNMRGDVKALSVVKTSLDRAASIGDTALAAAETISDLLIQLREKATSASDTSLDAGDRSAYNNDFVNIRAQIQEIVAAAEFDGVNLLDGSNPNGVEFIADPDGSDTLTLVAEDLSLGGAVLTLTTSADLSSATAAQAALSAIQSSLSNLNGSLSRIGSSTQQIENHGVFVTKLQDSLTAGVGALVDADLAQESALLQSLQVKQQLGVQSLSIANSAPATILSLFQN